MRFAGGVGRLAANHILVYHELVDIEIVDPSQMEAV